MVTQKAIITLNQTQITSPLHKLVVTTHPINPTPTEMILHLDQTTHTQPTTPKYHNQ